MRKPLQLTYTKKGIFDTNSIALVWKKMKRTIFQLIYEGFLDWLQRTNGFPPQLTRNGCLQRAQILLGVWSIVWFISLFLGDEINMVVYVKKSKTTELPKDLRNETCKNGRRQM